MKKFKVFLTVATMVTLLVGGIILYGPGDPDPTTHNTPKTIHLG